MSVEICFLEELPILDLARLLVEMSEQLGERGLFKCTGDLSRDLDAYRAFLKEHACVNLEVENPQWQLVVEHLLLEAFKRLVAPTNIRSGTAPYGDDYQAVFACQYWYIVAAQKVCTFLIYSKADSVNRFAIWFYLAQWRIFLLGKVSHMKAVCINAYCVLWRYLFATYNREPNKI